MEIYVDAISLKLSRHSRRRYQYLPTKCYILSDSRISRKDPCSLYLFSFVHCEVLEYGASMGHTFKYKQTSLYMRGKSSLENVLRSLIISCP